MKFLDGDFFKVPIQFVKINSPMSFGVYIHLTLNNRFLRLVNPGQSLDDDRYNTFIKRGLTYLFVHKNDRIQLLDYLNKIAITNNDTEIQSLIEEVNAMDALVKSSCEISTKEKSRERIEQVLEALNSNIVSEIYSSQTLPPEDSIESLSSISEELVRNLIEIDSTDEEIVEKGFEGIKKLSVDILALVTQGGDIYEIAKSLILMGAAIKDHSVAVSTLAVTFAILFGKMNKDELAMLPLAALFHDYGLLNLDPELIQKPEVLRNPEEHRVYQEAVVYGPKKLVELNPEFPGLSIRAITEVHESYDGLGFPNNLKGSQIHDLSSILSMANTFDKIIKGRIDGAKRNPKEAFDILIGIGQPIGKLPVFNPKYISMLPSLVKF